MRISFLTADRASWTSCSKILRRKKLSKVSVEIAKFNQKQLLDDLILVSFQLFPVEELEESFLFLQVRNFKFV